MAALVRALRLASASDVDVNALASEADRSLMLVSLAEIVLVTTLSEALADCDDDVLAEVWAEASLADNALKEFIEADALAEASL